MCQRRKNGATPLDLAIDATCRKILEHHAAAYTSITKDPTTLVAAALAHCAALSASEKPLPATALSLGAHHFDPCFLWAPLAARAAVVAWARNAFIFQLAATSHIQKDLPDDCIGDVLEFFVTTHKESELFAKHCTSPEARVWVRNVVAAAVVVSFTRVIRCLMLCQSGVPTSCFSHLTRSCFVLHAVSYVSLSLSVKGNG